ncbi:MAG: hypothetical protein WCP21_17970, partial [Armatimonadota bacterium]
YDDDGQRTRIEREDGTRIYYSYDLAHRLTGEDWLDPSDAHLYAFAYDYDAAGNRLQKTFNGEVTYYAYNNLNQLETEAILGGDTTEYTWTADGEMATKHEAAGWTYYTWDVDESLKQIAAPNVTLENKYNSRMQRVWRSEDGDASNLIYDSQRLIAEATDGDLSRYYLSEGGSVVSLLLAQFGSEHWFLSDALGTTLGLTGEAGSLSDTFLYEAFGTSLGRTGTTATSCQYVGGYGYFDEASIRLKQIWWRWLGTSVVAWLSLDPDRDRVHAHVYVSGDPTAMIDPTGLWGWYWPPWGPPPPPPLPPPPRPPNPGQIDAVIEIRQACREVISGQEMVGGGATECCLVLAQRVIDLGMQYLYADRIPAAKISACADDCMKRYDEYKQARDLTGLAKATGHCLNCQFAMEQLTEGLLDTLIFAPDVIRTW